jgi:hypothetical protein
VQAANEAVCRRHSAGTRRTAGHLPFTPRFKKAQELALREAIHLGNNYVGTEHLLLGLIREGAGVGALALADCGTAEADRGFSGAVRAKVLELLRGYDDADRRRVAATQEPKSVLTPEDGPVIADLFASWAQREGILPRVTEEQCRDLAKAFAYGYACGAGSAAGDAAVARLRARLGKLDPAGQLTERADGDRHSRRGTGRDVPRLGRVMHGDEQPEHKREYYPRDESEACRAFPVRGDPPGSDHGERDDDAGNGVVSAGTGCSRGDWVHTFDVRSRLPGCHPRGAAECQADLLCSH